MYKLTETHAVMQWSNLAIQQNAKSTKIKTEAKSVFWGCLEQMGLLTDCMGNPFTFSTFYLSPLLFNQPVTIVGYGSHRSSWESLFGLLAQEFLIEGCPSEATSALQYFWGPANGVKATKATELKSYAKMAKWHCQLTSHGSCEKHSSLYI